jgi:tRNA (guanine-N7-)-methyltransferase
LAKRKLERFAENATFSHFFQPNWENLQEGFPLQGNWNRDFFLNDHPIVIEVGCGKGEYTVALATKYPDKNFIGIDKKGARMWRGAKTSIETALPNVAFVRALAENLPKLFGVKEVDELWITFPEPQPNSPRIKKRVTSPHFLQRYRSFLKPGGMIHLKTDNQEFYEYTLEVIRTDGHRLLYSNPDLYDQAGDPEVADVIPVQTHYEKIWLEQGLKIKYLRFCLNMAVI